MQIPNPMRFARPGRRVAACLLLLLLSQAIPARIQAGEAKAPPLRVAVLDFRPPASAPWLGAAVREAIAVKLAGIDGVDVLERERMQAILAAKSEEDASPSLLGVSHLLTGAIQLAGEWPKEDAKLRITATIVAAETAKVEGGASFVLDGMAPDLFRLESELAERFAKALGKEAPALAIDYREERNIDAKRLFGEGLAKLIAVERAAPELTMDSDAFEIFKGASEAPTNEGGETAAAETSNPEMPSALSAERRAELSHLLEASVSLFRKAQEKNEGTFFARAHHYEARARDLLARVQPDQSASAKVRDETVRKFRQDAADAAPAFFDLGRALEANRNYRAALDAYGDFNRWVNEKARPFRWVSPSFCESLVLTEAGPRYFEQGKRLKDQPDGGDSFRRDWGRPFKLDGGEFFLLTRDLYVECRDAFSGALKWRTRSLRRPQGKGGYAMVIRKDRVYVASCEALQAIDRATGEEVYQRQEKPPRPRPNYWAIRLYVFEAGGFMIRQHRGGITVHRLEDGVTVDTFPYKYSSRTVLAPLNERLYIGHLYYKTKLYRFTPALPKAGADCDREAVVDLGFPIANLWPGEDHLLIRTSNEPRLARDDKWFRYYPEGNRLESCKEPLFFSYIYNTIPANVEEAVIPLIDRESGRYRLIPARYLLPRTVTDRMDEDDGVRGIRAVLPWVILEGNRLWIWARQTLVLLNADDGRLLWRKYLPNSFNNMDIHGHLAAIRGKNESVLTYRVGDTSGAVRSVDACVRQAECHLALEDYSAANRALQDGMLQDATHLGAWSALARLHGRLGNRNDEMAAYARFLDLAPRTHSVSKEALRLLKERTGLIAYLDAPGLSGMRWTDAGLVLRRAMAGNTETDLFRMPQKTWSRNLPLDGEWCAVRGDEWIGFRAGKWYPRESYSRPFGKRVEVPEEEIRRNDKVPDKESVFYAYDVASGKKTTLYRFDGFDNRHYDPCFHWHGACVMDGNLAVVGMKERHLACIDLAAGKELWRMPFEGWVCIEAEADRFFAAQVRSPDHPRYALACHGLTSGDLLWETEIELGSPPALPPPAKRKRVDVPDALSEAYRAFVAVVGKEVWLTYALSYDQSDYWKDPRQPLYRFDLETGRHLGTMCLPLLVYGGGATSRGKILDFFIWRYATAEPSERFPLSPEARYLGDLPSDFRVQVADFYETHPRRLARFQPLAHLAEEYDLSRHRQVLNEIIEDKEKRKALIRRWRQPMMRFPIGNNAAMNILRHYLSQPTLCEVEEKWLARQIISRWDGPRRTPDINEFAYPAELYTEAYCLLADGDGGASLGAVGSHQGRLQLIGMAPHYPILTSFRHAAPICCGDISALMRHGPTFSYRDGSEHIYIYDWQKLVHYLTRSVQTERGRFAVAPKPLRLAAAFDGELKTAVTHAPGAEPMALGIDTGVDATVKRIRFAPAAGRAAAMKEGFFQVSTKSECGGFRNIAVVKDDPAEGWNEIALAEPVSGRFFRFVAAAGQPLAVAELDFGAEYPKVEEEPPVVIASLPRIASLYAVKETLSGATPLVLYPGLKEQRNGGNDMDIEALNQTPIATIRLALANDAMALYAEVLDRHLTPGMKAWDRTNFDLYVTTLDDITVRQVVFLPKHPDGRCEIHLHRMGKKLDPAPFPYKITARKDYGYEVTALIPLSLLGLTPDAKDFLLEVAATASPAKVAPAQFTTLFGSRMAFRDNRNFHRAEVERSK